MAPTPEAEVLNNPMDLSGCRYLVTGASSGIGRSTAVLLDELGATLILTGRDATRLYETATMLSKPAISEKFDLSAMEELPVWLKNLAAVTGPIDGIVHAAGVQSTMPLRYLKERQVQETLDINLKSAIGLAKGFRQKGVGRTPGSLVFISSAASRSGIPGQAAYAASKAGLEAACRCMAMELARENIRVNAILPGLVQTDMADRWLKIATPEQEARMRANHPLGLGQARDVAFAAAFLLSQTTSRWITGATIAVDGGCSAGAV